MYSTLAAANDADALDDSPFLFDQAHDDILSMSHDAHLKTSGGPHAISMPGLSNMIYGQYSESTPSSVHFGDAHEASEASAREDRDGSLSSEFAIGQEHNHVPSPLHYQQPSLNSYPNGKPVKIESSKNIIATSLPNVHVNGAVSSDDTRPSHLSNGNVTEKSSLNQISATSSAAPPPKSTAEKIVNPAKTKSSDFKANASIPPAMSWEEFARQSILAAQSSRLNPFSLHPEEYKLLRNHITIPQVTIYLNIRNAILRLWTRNPLVYVSLEEAAGCAREKRYFDLAKIAYLWLMRNGYINFGCVEVPKIVNSTPRNKAKAQRTIVVVGAGMSGLGCARHLEALFAQLGDQWTNAGERPPRVIILEARPRVGGRVYSHPLHGQKSDVIPRGHRCTAEMGAQIITGFEHGNPLNAIIRGQLGIPYHGLRDNTVLYDHDGSIVNRGQDMRVEKLYNDVLERASVYRKRPESYRTVEGDRNLILIGRDPSDSGGPTIASLEKSNTPLPVDVNTKASTTEEKPSAGVENIGGRAYQLVAGYNPNNTAVKSAIRMGWQALPNVQVGQTLDLYGAANSYIYPTLGKTMDDGIKQYQKLINLRPKDLRLLNWHHANLEYANAASVNQLSLSGWDQDIGNEFEGEHTEIIGGYQQVPRGLWQCPERMDVRFKSPIKSVHYDAQEQRVGKAVRVECANGETIEADRVVLTTPLGVLKSGSINFQPPLPDWKQGVIERMGFGLLNKVILVYEKPFWEPERDMFGLLNDSEQPESLNPEDYASGRGRFYLFWNRIKTSGRPMLVALMAGEAAHYAEANSDEDLVREVTERLTRIFAPDAVPAPVETIVTRWRRDPYTCGSYSYVAAETQAGDYDVMAKPHGPLHFAGEATCGTHPATVHGAYLSGLRAAAEVVEAMIGPIQVPSPLIEKKIKAEHSVTTPDWKPKETPASARGTPNHLNGTGARSRDEDYEASIIGAIVSELGDRPVKPGRGGVNPFLLFTKDHWHTCKKQCDERRQRSTKDANAKASKTEIRTALGLKWRTADPEIKKPYLDQTQTAKEDAIANAALFNERVAAYDREASRIRNEYIHDHPATEGINEDLMTIGRSSMENRDQRLRRI
ncbi:hypothetical protein BU24DRAFT_411064 [Aaosphaeria arxii CBS 175.79]|uniref:SWIRM domain-containing protein n=1 Tax=Aaosphaeria arxii CBS 175.79 TaxID=1450172 RepID=A0A6A5XK19_9PLEO|nr:uncharacterized protein BU24DRAFT_411064 [Aaosphaeria arxii CBS 175.79]KAF2013303.1 hypothetical protein BU24DRAFT_411064 [Aaosphaeria arxii CBS 175.79]